MIQVYYLYKDSGLAGIKDYLADDQDLTKNDWQFTRDPAFAKTFQKDSVEIFRDRHELYDLNVGISFDIKNLFAEMERASEVTWALATALRMNEYELDSKDKESLELLKTGIAHMHWSAHDLKGQIKEKLEVNNFETRFRPVT